MEKTLTRGARPSIFSAALGASTVAAITALAFAGTPAQAAFPGVNGTVMR